MSVVGGVWLRTDQMHGKDKVLWWTGTKLLIKLPKQTLPFKSQISKSQPSV